MTKKTWHTGAPPSIGWWPASIMRDAEAIRWWDGKDWSRVAVPTQNKTEAASIASVKAARHCGIEWSERWWL